MCGNGRDSANLILLTVHVHGFAGVLDFEEFLNLYKSCLSNAKVRSKYADKVTVKYNKEGKAVLTVMTRSVSEAGTPAVKVTQWHNARVTANTSNFRCHHGERGAS